MGNKFEALRCHFCMSCFDWFLSLSMIDLFPSWRRSFFSQTCGRSHSWVMEHTAHQRKTNLVSCPSDPSNASPSQMVMATGSHKWQHTRPFLRERGLLPGRCCPGLVTFCLPGFPLAFAPKGGQVCSSHAWSGAPTASNCWKLPGSKALCKTWAAS